jgi:hypothetical protein
MEHLLRTACVRGPPDVHVMFRRSEDGERSRRRKGIARNMLRGESCGGCSCGDRDRAALGFEVCGWAFGFAPAGRIVDGDDGDDAARGASRTCCRRRAIVGGDSLGDGDEEDVVVLLAWAASSAGLAGLGLDCASGEEGETAMPKGVSSIFTLEEDATFLVAGWCIRGDCAAARALSLRWCCAERWLMGGTVRNCPEVDIVLRGWCLMQGPCVLRVQSGFYTLRLAFGVRRGQSMSCRGLFGMPKSQCTTHQDFVGSLPTSDRTAFGNFGVPQPQIINHHLNEYGLRRARLNQAIDTNHDGCIYPPLNDTRETRNKNVYGKVNGNTCCKHTRSTNPGPFLKLYVLLFVFFFSLLGSNIIASLSPSHAYHALMVYLSVRKARRCGKMKRPTLSSKHAVCNRMASRRHVSRGHTPGD